MCGIAGFIDFRDVPADQALLEEMSGALIHRGPDGQGFHRDGSTGLAHRRLSILDLEGGRQPMTTRDGKAWIVFNGEIYNFLELRRELEDRGHPFQTHSDTEVILHLYEEKGVDCVQDLRGMFAFGLWDPARRRLVLARDRVGIKPLYYYFDGSLLVFASELKSLLIHPGVPRQVDPAGISNYLTYQYIPAPRTPFVGIRKLLPAYLLIAENGRIEVRRYWRLETHRENRSEEEWSEELVHTLREAVAIHMRSDVPVGALLSGGIDSSLIVALAAETGGETLRTFSVGFQEAAVSELPYAREVAHRYGTRHTEHILEPSSIHSVPALVSHFDEPFADSSAIPCSRIAEVAARQVKVCLSGDGGDEAFAGYEAYRVANRLSRLDLIPLALRRLAVGPLERHYPEWVKGKGLLRFMTLSRADRYAEIMGIVDLSTRDWLLTREFREATSEEHPYERIRSLYGSLEGLDEIARLQRIDMETYLPDDILVKTDRTSMLHSLELRVPLLDHQVLELAFRMPTSVKYRMGEGKRILKRAFAHYLPSKILGRGKQGFSIPLRVWLRGDWKELVHDVLTDSRTRQRGVLDPDGLTRLLKSYQRGNRDLGSEVWAALVLELWFRAKVDDQGQGVSVAGMGQG